MNILTIPLKNIRRKIIRTCTILFIFTIGITSVVGLYKVSNYLANSLEEKLNKFGANIIIYPKKESINISYGGVTLGDVQYDINYFDVDRTIKRIKSIKYYDKISIIAPKLIVIDNINGKRVGFVGVNFNEELKIKSYWNVKGSLPKNDKEILIGGYLAGNLGLNIGKTVRILKEDFIISGILEKVGSEEDHLLFLDLKKLQKLSNLENKANFIEISALCAECPIEDIVEELEKSVPDSEINAVQKMIKQRMSAIHFVEHLSYLVISIILLTSCFMIALFIFNSVNERKKEIGILRSMGYTRWNIFVIFSFEGIFIGFLAAISGYLSGFIVSSYILDFLKIEGQVLSFSIFEMVYVISGVLLLSLISVIYPAYIGSKIEPIDTIVSI